MPLVKNEQPNALARIVGEIGGAAILVLAQALPASAQMSGNDLTPVCEDDSSYTTCEGYILGSWHGMRYGAVVAYQSSPFAKERWETPTAFIQSLLGVCVPEGVIHAQIAEIVVTYMAAHPETRHRPIQSITHSAMYEAFPCSKR